MPSFRRLAKLFNDLSVLKQVYLIVASAVAGADLLTLVFYSIFFADRLLLDLLLTSLIVIAVAFPLSYFFMARSARYAELAAELDRASRIDDLTGLLNRKTFLAEARRIVETTINETAGTLLFIDADHFKSVNDRFGHAAGDAVLRELACVLKASIGVNDLAGRLGGEEFAVMLEGAGRERPLQVCDSIRRRMKSVADMVGLRGRSITVSIGAAQHRLGQDLDVLLHAADKNLYAAKSKGRDCTVHGDPESASA